MIYENIAHLKSLRYNIVEGQNHITHIFIYFDDFVLEAGSDSIA